ncbi:unnamed protein product [Symbiodinium microadriaticum]|nr:unnamed protein product [Symbiodinium microadriaticum]
MRAALAQLETFFGPDLVHHDNTLLMQMSEGRLFKKPADMSFHQLAPGTQGSFDEPGREDGCLRCPASWQFTHLHLEAETSRRKSSGHGIRTWRRTWTSWRSCAYMQKNS